MSKERFKMSRPINKERQREIIEQGKKCKIVGNHYSALPGACAICGRKAYNAQEFRGLIEGFEHTKSFVCDECWYALPLAVRNNLAHQPYVHVKELRYAIRPRPSRDRLYKKFAGLSLYRSYIGINGLYYHIANIASFRLGFVPIKRESETRALGYPLAVIELKKPRVVIQEPFTSKPLSYYCSVVDGKAVFSGGDGLEETEKAIKRDISEGNDHFTNVEKIVKGEQK